jgi:hypothetical protein
MEVIFMKTTIIRLNNERAREYITSYDLAKSLEIDVCSREYEVMRDKLIDFSHKTSIFSIYPMGETNAKKYSLRCNVDWYLFIDIKEIMLALN